MLLCLQYLLIEDSSIFHSRQLGFVYATACHTQMPHCNLELKNEKINESNCFCCRNNFEFNDRNLIEN